MAYLGTVDRGRLIGVLAGIKPTLRQLIAKRRLQQELGAIGRLQLVRQGIEVQGT